MQFYFIRHAQSENNALWYLNQSPEGRKPDPDLTEIGQQQAELLAQYLARPTSSSNGTDPFNRNGFGITHLYTSLMHRALLTADVVAQELDLPMHAWVDIHERGGLYIEDHETEEKTQLSGYPRSHFEAQFPRLVLPDSIGEEGWWHNRIETIEDVPQRAERVIRGLLQRHGGSDDRVAVISHGGFYNNFLSALFNSPWPPTLLGAEVERWLWLNNTGITRLDFYEERFELVYTNRVDFLPPELIT